VRQVTRASNEQHNFDSFQLHSLKASFNLLVIKKLGCHECLLFYLKLFSHFAGEMQ
jgi:hypothetical protein